MDLIFLHGPPAAGKFTIASEIAAHTEAVLFHNHLTIDVAKSIFEFGTKQFWELVNDLRLVSFRAAAQADGQALLYTSCYDHPNDLEFFESVEEIFLSSNNSVRPVYLECNQSELENRVVSESRKRMGKIRSVEGLEKALGEWNCVPVPRQDCLSVNTNGKNPEVCAKEVIDKLGLADHN